MKSIHKLIKKLDTVKSLQLFQLFRFGGFFLTGILLAKGPLSINTIGVYESLMFFSGAVSFFWISGMLNGLLAKFKLVESGKQGAYLFNISIFISLMNVLLVLLLFFSESFAALFLKPDALIYYRWLLIFILFNNPVFLIEYLLLIKKQTVTLFFYGLINFIIQVLVVVVPLWLGFDLSTCLKGLIILAIIKLIFLGFLLNKFGEKKTDFTIWKEHLNYKIN